MGRRRGRTGAGGAVVSSLSENAGGTVRANTKKGRQPGSAARRKEDEELLQLAGSGTPAKQGSSSRGGPSSARETNDSLSLSGTGSKWLGKSPQQMLQEWCARNNRKKPYFSKMAGSEGLMRCTIPPGTKDGKKAKGAATQYVVGIGERPGDGFAALNVLHQVERGKPIQRILAPEFRDVWLDLDKRFEKVEKDNQRRERFKENKQKAIERREKAAKSQEGATISISSKSRQIIEDALEEHRTKTGSAKTAFHSSDKLQGNDDSAALIRDQLIGKGFANLDAADASQMFGNVSSALDYLCLNLDESELPLSFAPKSDIEVVQFKTRDGNQSIAAVDPDTRKVLTRLLCISRHAAEKALREAAGDICRAAITLYDTLTHGDMAKHAYSQKEDGASPATALPASEERVVESESIDAIYETDATFGVGILSSFPRQWTAIVQMKEGVPGIACHHSVTVAFVDVHGLYPYTAPVILVASTFEEDSDRKNLMSPAQRRLLMRAAAGEVIRLRETALLEPSSDCGCSTPVPLIHAVLSFLSCASMEELLTSASTMSRTRNSPSLARDLPRPSHRTLERKTPLKHDRNSFSRNSTQILPVHPLRDSDALREMRKRREALPAHKSRHFIIEKVRENSVTVISGATGSGKTTQVPQFLLEEASKTRNPVFMVCTQPRRIAAMSVAERVASERCEKIGETIGYQVKLNSKVSRKTRLLFCTTGVLLRRLQSDPNLDSLTHVFVDEVHERSVETDFLLLLLREILKTRPKLRVVLMSATVDAEKFATYFASALMTKNTVPIISIPGRTFPVNERYLSDAIELTNYRLRPGDPYSKKVGNVIHHGKYGPSPDRESIKPVHQNSATLAAAVDDPLPDDDDDDGEDSSATITNDTLLVPANGSQPTIAEGNFATQAGSSVSKTNAEHKKTLSVIDEAIVNIDLITALVSRIDIEDRKTQSLGAILIFLPGAAEISAVIRRLASGSRANLLWPLPLHSLLSPDEQGKVFQKPVRGKRKVICATNIAETSITVEDVTTVIDTLKAKEMTFDSLNSASVLTECFISRAAAKQRAGRAGRVSKGTCYRLVKEHTFSNRLSAQQTPEIKRVALEHLVLNILSIIPEEKSKNDPHAFLAKAVDPPDPHAVTIAVANLIEIGALERTEDVPNQDDRSVRMTALGKHLSGLPVDARIGKLLVYASVFSCVDAALTIAATVTERSPFYAPFDRREEARAAREPLVWGKSDLLTYVKAFDAWRDIRQQGNGYAAEQSFCSKHFLSRKTLLAISDGRKQLADALLDAGFGPPTGRTAARGWELDPDMNKFGTNLRVLRAVTCAALYPNIARVDLPDATYRQVAGGSVVNKLDSKKLKLRAKSGERLFLHPESVNFFQGNYDTRWLAYFAKVKTSRVFIRETSMVSPYALLMFGGEIAIHHEKGQMSVDKWILFKAPARIAVLARELRRELDGLLLKKFENSEADLNKDGQAINDAILRLITMEG